VELIEYQKSETIQKDFLEARGEGLYHLLFGVSDLEKTPNKFKVTGIDGLQETDMSAAEDLPTRLPTRSETLLWKW